MLKQPSEAFCRILGGINGGSYRQESSFLALCQVLSHGAGRHFQRAGNDLIRGAASFETPHLLDYFGAFGRAPQLHAGCLLLGQGRLGVFGNLNQLLGGDSGQHRNDDITEGPE